jgi:hypothetical protein
MMIVAALNHHELAGEIHRLIGAEQYAEAQELLPSFAQAVIGACNESWQEQEFLEAKQFLQSALVAVKSRRAHYLSELVDLGHERAYTGIREPRSSFDCVG